MSNITRNQLIDILSSGVHTVTFTKKNGDTVTYQVSRDWEYLRSIADEIGYVEPKGNYHEEHVAQDKAYNYVTVFKITEDSGFRRINVNTVVEVDGESI